MDAPPVKPETPPVSSPNETLQSPAPTTPEVRAALADKMKGLVEFRDDLMVFTDPNGTRPYPAERLAEIVTADLPEGFDQVQARAVERHVSAGLMLGELRDDFRRFAGRTLPLAAGTPVYRGEAYRTLTALRERLAELAGELGARVGDVAQSWTLEEAAAFAFATGRGLRYRMVPLSRKHGTLRPIWQTAERLVAAAVGQKEVVALAGTRFRIVGRPSVRRVAGVMEVRVEVEEVQP